MALPLIKFKNVVFWGIPENERGTILEEFCLLIPSIPQIREHAHFVNEGASPSSIHFPDSEFVNETIIIAHHDASYQGHEFYWWLSASAFFLTHLSMGDPVEFRYFKMIAYSDEKTENTVLYNNDTLDSFAIHIGEGEKYAYDDISRYLAIQYDAR